MKSSSGIANGVILLKCKRLLYFFILIHSQDILIYLLNHQNKFIKPSNDVKSIYIKYIYFCHIYSVKCE